MRMGVEWNGGGMWVGLAWAQNGVGNSGSGDVGLNKRILDLRSLTGE